MTLAVLIQDDLVSRVANELRVTGGFIRELPAGSNVMVGYIRSGSLQVRQPFTGDLDAAARRIGSGRRVPVGRSGLSYPRTLRLLNASRRDIQGISRVLL